MVRTCVPNTNSDRHRLERRHACVSAAAAVAPGCLYEPPSCAATATASLLCKTRRPCRPAAHVSNTPALHNNRQPIHQQLLLLCPAACCCHMKTLPSTPHLLQHPRLLALLHALDGMVLNRLLLAPLVHRGVLALADLLVYAAQGVLWHAKDVC